LHFTVETAGLNFCVVDELRAFVEEYLVEFGNDIDRLKLIPGEIKSFMKYIKESKGFEIDNLAENIDLGALIDEFFDSKSKTETAKATDENVQDNFSITSNWVGSFFTPDLADLDKKSEEREVDIEIFILESHLSDHTDDNTKRFT